MAENLMTKDHKTTNDAYREGYDRTFGKELYLFGDETIEIATEAEESIYFVSRENNKEK